MNTGFNDALVSNLKLARVCKIKFRKITFTGYVPCEMRLSRTGKTSTIVMMFISRNNFLIYLYKKKHITTVHAERNDLDLRRVKNLRSLRNFLLKSII